MTRSALENAASIASTLLTTESLVADKPQPPAPAAPAAPDMGACTKTCLDLLKTLNFATQECSPYAKLTPQTQK